MDFDAAQAILSQGGAKRLRELYGFGETQVVYQQERYAALAKAHAAFFPMAQPRFFSAPGRTEISGNHTDHNRGIVLAAAVNLDTVCAASPNDTGIITLYSHGYEKPFVVDTSNLAPVQEERNGTCAIIRGVCAGIVHAGGKIGGFNAVVSSSVLIGSGLSSSAAFEVMVATVLDHLYGDGCMDTILKAQIAQYAENEYFGKPSGLMDQAASSIGGLNQIDFGRQTPVVKHMELDFNDSGISIVVVNTGTSHDDLTEHYASIPVEMKRVAAHFGREVLRDVDENAFYGALPALRKVLPERALLRAMHFFDENKRVLAMSRAIKSDDIPGFVQKAVESGESSWMLLQNIYAPGTRQTLALALAVSRKLLAGRGAWRVHGGGFAGTIQAFVPHDRMPEYLSAMNGLFGENSCSVLSVRNTGATEVIFK